MLYFKKAKNVIQMQQKKELCRFMENVLWIIKSVKSGLQSSVQSDRSEEVDSNQIETLFEINQH